MNFTNIERIKKEIYNHVQVYPLLREQMINMLYWQINWQMFDLVEDQIFSIRFQISEETDK